MSATELNVGDTVLSMVGKLRETGTMSAENNVVRFTGHLRKYPGLMYLT